MATNATIDPEKEKADIAETERGGARMDEVEHEQSYADMKSKRAAQRATRNLRRGFQAGDTVSLPRGPAPASMVNPQDEADSIAEIERGHKRMDEVEREEVAARREEVANIGAGLKVKPVRPTDAIKNPSAPFQKAGIRVPTKESIVARDTALAEREAERANSRLDRARAETKAEFDELLKDPTEDELRAIYKKYGWNFDNFLAKHGHLLSSRGGKEKAETPLDEAAWKTPDTDTTHVTRGADKAITGGYTERNFGAAGTRRVYQKDDGTHKAGEVEWVDANGKVISAPSSAKLQAEMDANHKTLADSRLNNVSAFMSDESRAAAAAAEHNAAINDWERAAKLQREGKEAEAEKLFASVRARSAASKERNRRIRAEKDIMIGTQIDSAMQDFLGNYQKIKERLAANPNDKGVFSDDPNGADAFIHAKKDDQGKTHYYVRGYLDRDAMTQGNADYAQKGGYTSLKNMFVEMEVQPNGMPILDNDNQPIKPRIVMSTQRNAAGSPERLDSYNADQALGIIQRAWMAKGLDAKRALERAGESFGTYGNFQSFKELTRQQQHDQALKDKTTEAAINKTNADAAAATMKAQTDAEEAKNRRIVSEAQAKQANAIAEHYLAESEKTREQIKAMPKKEQDAFVAGFLKEVADKSADMTPKEREDYLVFCEGALRKLCGIGGALTGDKADLLDEEHKGGRVSPVHRTAQTADGIVIATGADGKPITISNEVIGFLKNIGVDTSPLVGAGAKPTTPTGDGTATPTEPPKTEPPPKNKPPKPEAPVDEQTKKENELTEIGGTIDVNGDYQVSDWKILSYPGNRGVYKPNGFLNRISGNVSGGSFSNIDDALRAQRAVAAAKSKYAKEEADTRHKLENAAKKKGWSKQKQAVWVDEQLKIFRYNYEDPASKSLGMIAKMDIG